MWRLVVRIVLKFKTCKTCGLKFRTICVNLTKSVIVSWVNWWQDMLIWQSTTCADLDPCLDEVISFSNRFSNLGKSVSLDVVSGLPHGFLGFNRFFFVRSTSFVTNQPKIWRLILSDLRVLQALKFRTICVNLHQSDKFSCHTLG